MNKTAAAGKVLYFAGRCDLLKLALPVYGRRLVPPSRRGLLAPSDERRGCLMVTFGELFQYTLVIIGIIGLVITVYKKK